MSSTIGVSLLGAGNVGGGVIAALREGEERYAAQIGCPLELRQVLVRDAGRVREGVVPSNMTTDIDSVLSDPGTQIVVEVMGGEDPARDYIEQSLASGRHVVTANKEVMAKCGPELLELAYENRVRLLYEASVGGGIPIVRPLARDLLANEVRAVTGIINGTTNYMLTEMAQRGADYAEVLTDAQNLGYAESDPTNDVEGVDSAYKLSILCGLAFRVSISPDHIARTGITTLSARDFRYAEELGYTIKLLASASLIDDVIEASVQPTLVRHNEPIAKVDGVLNALQVEADLVGRVLFAGPGAGAAPTASAVLADVIDVARSVESGSIAPEAVAYRSVPMRSSDEQESRYYIRMTGTNRPGVLAKVAGAFGEHGINIASVIQFGMEEHASTEEFVITTYLANSGRLDAALLKIRMFEEVAEVGNVLTVAS